MMFIGLVIGLVPFAGLPQALIEFLLPALGIAVLAIGYSLKNRRAHTPPEYGVESNPEYGTSS